MTIYDTEKYNEAWEVSVDGDISGKLEELVSKISKKVEGMEILDITATARVLIPGVLLDDMTLDIEFAQIKDPKRPEFEDGGMYGGPRILAWKGTDVATGQLVWDHSDEPGRIGA